MNLIFIENYKNKLELDCLLLFKNPTKLTKILQKYKK